MAATMQGFAGEAGMDRYRISFEQRPKYLYVTVTGDSSSETISRYIADIRHACVRLGVFRVLAVVHLEGPGISQQNISIIKQFSVTERFKVEFQTLIQDLFNSPVFNFPFSNISVPGQAGRLNAVLSQGDPGNTTVVSNRWVTMRVRLLF